MYKGTFNHLHTRIFAGVVYPCIYNEEKKVKITNGDPLQLTVISNILENVHFNPDNDEYIVIPFPLIKGKNRVKIIDMSSYPKIFDDLSLTFTDLEKSEYECNIVGKYETEFLTKIDDLDLNYEIKEHYKEGFGFIKCRPKFYKFKNKSDNIKETKTAFLPIAYVHEINPDTKMFIPTKLIFLTKPVIKSSDAGSNLLAGESDELDNSTNDRFINWFLKKKEKEKEKPAEYVIKSSEKSFEIYIINFPRITKNPLINQTGSDVKEKKIKERHDLYLSKSKFPKNLEIKKIDFIHQVNINNNYKFNHNLYC